MRSKISSALKSARDSALVPGINLEGPLFPDVPISPTSGEDEAGNVRVRGVHGRRLSG